MQIADFGRELRNLPLASEAKRLKTGINAWAFPPNLSLPQCFKLARRAGFDGIELALSEDGPVSLLSTEKDLAAIRSSAETISLQVCSLASGLGWKYPLTSEDTAIAQRGKEIIGAGLQVAAWLGVDVMLVVPGVVTKEVPYDAAYERAFDAIKELAPTAEKLGVSIGIENVWSRFLLSPLEMRDFIDGIGSPAVCAYFDAGNVLVNGFPEHWISILGKRIRKVHVKDFKTAIGNIQGFANVLQGDLDWIGVRNALRDVGYDDYVIAEVPGYKTLPDLGVRHCGEAMKRVFSRA